MPDSQETNAAWGSDSRTLFYWHNSEPKLMAVDVASEPFVVISPPRVALDLDAAELSSVRRDLLAVFPDAKNFLMVQPIWPDAVRGDIILVENWLEEFRRDPE